MTHLLLIVVLCCIVLQYAVFKNSIDEASGVMQWAVEKFGLAPAIITTKIVIIAIFVALYFFTTIPWYVYLIGVAYYLYRSGKGLVLWRAVVAQIKKQSDSGGSSPQS
jgi:hypothetical protein